MTTKPTKLTSTKPTIFEIPDGAALASTALKSIGEGAEAFAKEVAQKYRHILASDDSVKQFQFAQDMINGNLPEHDDVRVKRCQACGYFFRDKTRPNNGKVCSRGCKHKKDATLDAERKRQKSGSLKRLSAIDMYYVDRDENGELLEYPFYMDCKEGTRTDLQIMELVDRDRIKFMGAGNEFDAYAGYVENKRGKGRKKVTREYSDDRDATKFKRTINAKTQVSSAEFRTSGRTKSYKWDSNEYEVYRAERYGEASLQAARNRALAQAGELTGYELRAN